MSSETSTNTTGFRLWHFFTLAGLLAATVVVFVARPSDLPALFLLVAVVGSASAVCFAVYRTVSPLVSASFHESGEIIGGRTRAALEREKTLVVRAIKELEFDRAMGKISEDDFREMVGRFRARAITLMKKLDEETPNYHYQIEDELAKRLNEVGIQTPDKCSTCDACGANNESDAKFCKSCGARIE